MSLTVHTQAPTMIGAMTQRASDLGDPELVQCKAWEMVVPQPDAERLVCGWIMYAPYAHPYWDYYAIECIHLRPGPESLLIYDPEATHEFVLWALAPKRVPVLDGANVFLHPKNFAAQFRVASDEDAKTIMHAAVKDVIDERLNPDTDARSLWVRRFGDKMMRT